MQSRLESFVEANVSTWIGMLGSFLITVAINWAWFPILGIFWASLATTAACTVWSLARGYHVRRYFEKRRTLHHNKVL